MVHNGGMTAVVAIRVKPNSARTRVGGHHDGPYGPALVVAVNAPAVDGRATDAALRAVAKALRLRLADVSLKAGPTSRDKLIEVAAAPADLTERVNALRGA
jgi:uncharacterized protein YggU (UPF0235/DUF167 family)